MIDKKEYEILKLVINDISEYLRCNETEIVNSPYWIGKASARIFQLIRSYENTDEPIEED